MTQPELIALAKQAAAAAELDPALVCAIVEQESGWEPWAVRYEPGYYERYVAPHGFTPTEAQARSFSWGLMQMMGDSARSLGFTGHLASLCDPATGLAWGCRFFVEKVKLAGGDVRKGLLYWNGGGNPEYPDQVLQRKQQYL
jgi:soluble lytic murein transglycosylase-like protein